MVADPNIINPVTPIVNGLPVSADNPMPVGVPAGAVGIPIVLGASGLNVTAPAGTAENALATVAIPALGPNDQLFWYTRWSYTNGADDKILRNRFGGIGGTIYGTTTATTTASVIDLRMLGNNGATNAQTGPAQGIGIPFAASTSGSQVSSVDTSVPTTLVFTAQKENGADTVILRGYLVLLIRGVA